MVVHFGGMELKPIGKIPDSNRILYAAFPSSMEDLLRTTRYPSKYLALPAFVWMTPLLLAFFDSIFGS
jgi:hypothetical protein